MKTGQDVDDLIMGMASQIAEREDNIVVEDLRGVYSFFFITYIKYQNLSLLPMGFHIQVTCLCAEMQSK